VDLLGEPEHAFQPVLKKPFAKDYFGDNPGNAMLLLSFKKISTTRILLLQNHLAICWKRFEISKTLMKQRL